MIGVRETGFDREKLFTQGFPYGHLLFQIRGHM
jgi:hypothetical protein